MWGDLLRSARAIADLPRQCSATSKRTGERCRQAPILGGTVCRHHGGGSPSVKRKAALRLAELVDPAIATLGREMVKAETSADRQRAANSILDRAGITRGQSAELDVARALLLERLVALRGGGAMGSALMLAADADVVDAEVVEDPPKKRGRK